MTVLNVLTIYPFGEGLDAAFRRHGHRVFVVDFKLRPQYQHTDAVVLPAPDPKHPELPVLRRWEPPKLGWDLVFARPFCTTYSRASAFMHYRDNVTGRALTEHAREHDAIVCSMLRIIQDAKPRLGWVLENPHALLAKMGFMHDIPITTVTLCQYGSPYRKATDLFGLLPMDFEPRTCKVGDTCHEHSKWVDKNGNTWGGFANNITAGRKFDKQTAFERAFLPYRLSSDLERGYVRMAESVSVSSTRTDRRPDRPATDTAVFY